ncbi:t-SNARE [Rhizophagus irregularis]|uniref:t-SNARE n=3 Tax=Rhizophagus irregularis TaxID=588596 RepID=A0A2I1F4T7_9GLOM|nr:SNARE Psy1 [Rhizophagus irregularis DAOM 181602=DAOM 197198]EXX53986.1 Sso1p [Rhizophagus irregularis DAOM 197198w]PKC01859.1 t-SNARE [Rhizophagus irregularis]PKC58024.1 t-SNARE [Rhizophagus irregularis]PKY29377.1 t-SNARE [Rhizophagus irregularis]POG74320.1 SNARE Psy1 [Rhizophagus irregularis DAOM 181602=DAOM 197198]|eukprot:XP_025181186.1 SNARE Psy1 [Rhizophagus irregularis DAOM 181602=DAOM 197198]
MAHSQGYNASGQFLEEASAIDQGIKKIQDNIGRIQMLQTYIIVSTSDQQADTHRKEREGLMTETKNLLFELKDRIKKIQYENARLPKNDLNLNIRKQRHEVLHEKFTNVLEEYRNVEDEYMRHQKDRMARQYRVVNPEANQQEIDDYLANPSGQSVFQQAVIRTGEAKAALAEVQKRHGDIKQIEQTISELASLFSEMQLQVEEQDPVLASVEEDVTETLVKIEKAGDALTHANKDAIKARKKKWILLGIISFIVFIIVVIIIFQFRHKSSDSSAPPATTTTITATSNTLATPTPTSTLSPP